MRRPPHLDSADEIPVANSGVIARRELPTPSCLLQLRSLLVRRPLGASLFFVGEVPRCRLRRSAGEVGEVLPVSGEGGGGWARLVAEVLAGREARGADPPSRSQRD